MSRADQTQGIVADTLFIGLTRPAMAFGVPYSALLATAVITVEAFLLSRNLLALLLCAPLLGLSRLVCASEPRYFELWAAWAPQAIGHYLANPRYWRAATLGPLGARQEPWVRT
jgi:type IV secretion system protein VirB3